MHEGHIWPAATGDSGILLLEYGKLIIGNLETGACDPVTCDPVPYSTSRTRRHVMF